MKRIIGRIGLETSAIGMGCWAIGGEWDFDGVQAGWGATNDAESIKAIHAAHDHGIRLFDTAAIYGAGHCEMLLGRALKGKRENCIISTKFGYKIVVPGKSVGNYGDPQGNDDVISHLKADCEASLKRLRMEYIDILLLHIDNYNSQLAGKLMIALEDLVKEGKIRSYGWSTDDPEKVKLWLPGKHFSSIMNNFNIAVDATNILDICEKNDIAALSSGPLAMGFLTGKYTIDSKFSKTDVRATDWAKENYQKPVMQKLDKLKEIMTSKGRSLTQGALAWIWAKREFTIPTPGIRTVKQAVESAKAMSFGPLSPSELSQIEEVMGR